MSTTYRAIEVKKPGECSEVRKPLLDPGPNQVRIRVEACGVCHSDSGTVEGLFPIDWPRVPGHEVVGRIDTLGSGVQGWAVGQRVGVGFLGRYCNRSARRIERLKYTLEPASERHIKSMVRLLARKNGSFKGKVDCDD